MVQDTIEIKTSAARAAYEQAPAEMKPTLETLFGKANILPITERIKSWPDVLAWHGETENDFGVRCMGLDSDEIGYRMCKMWCAALNEGWTPDYANTDEPKYHVWMKYTKGSGFSFYHCDYNYVSSSVGSRLVLKSRELAEHYGKHATDAINKFFL